MHGDPRRNRPDREIPRWQAIRREANFRKAVEDVTLQASGADRRFTRRHLIPLGLAIIIGSGVYSFIGARVSEIGPAYTAVALALAAVACLGAALCFAEMASTVPVSGSAYTYSYASLGRLRAWLVGWLLLLQYSAGAGIIVVDWVRFISVLFTPPKPPPTTVAPWLAIVGGGALIILLTLGLHFVERQGDRLSGTGDRRPWFTATMATIGIMVTVKLLALVLAIIVGFYVAMTTAPTVAVRNEDVDFSPSGILPAFAILYFAFIGFDAVPTAAEETRYPQRDLPRGILSALGIAALLYFSFLAATYFLALRTGNSGNDLLAMTADRAEWLMIVVRIGAVVGLPAGVVILIYGQSRIFRAIRRDGLLSFSQAPVPPAEGGASHSPTLRYGSLLSGGAVAVGIAVAALDPPAATRMVNLATAGAFAIVAFSTAVLRYQRPDLPRTFRVPMLPVVAGTTIVISAALLPNAIAEIPWVLIWLAIGAVVQLIILDGRVRYIRRAAANDRSEL